jgi:hypothetical protein
MSSVCRGHAEFESDGTVSSTKGEHDDIETQFWSRCRLSLACSETDLITNFSALCCIGFVKSFVTAVDMYS